MRVYRPVGLLALTGLGMVAAVPSAVGEDTRVTRRVSVSSDGGQGDNISFGPAISANGRYVAFTSTASTLASGDTNGGDDVFVRDRRTGVTRRVSVSSDGRQGDGGSFGAAISGNGRYVVFTSNASTLVPGDTNGMVDVFMRDRRTQTTERISETDDGEQATDTSFAAVISPTGRYVGFEAWSSLVPQDTNGIADAYIRDRKTGVLDLVSVSTDGEQGNGESGTPVMSANGRFVVFYSYNGLAPGDVDEFIDVYVRDRLAGVTERISVSSAGESGDGDSYSPAISADGRFVAFTSGASNLAPGGILGGPNVYLRDRQTGVISWIAASSGDPAISADGRFIAFASGASDLIPGDTNAALDVLVRDQRTGRTRRVSVSSGGLQGNGASHQPAISPTGRYVAFASEASSLVPGDTNGWQDVFVRDRLQR